MIGVAEAAPGSGTIPVVAELTFYAGTMDCGKSTLALQTDHNHASRGRAGLVFTQLDRAGGSVLSSRLGLQVPAIEVDEALDLREVVVARLSAGTRVDYLICDEAQFYTTAQVEQLAQIVDEFGIDVFAFGIMTDFRTRLFPGSARLVEIADRVQLLQVEALCWCGARAIHNARTVGGRMVIEGEQVVVGDTGGDTGSAAGRDTGSTAEPGDVSYEVLCRRHYRAQLTSAKARYLLAADEPLPFDAS